jgi:hypothetical protein
MTLEMLVRQRGRHKADGTSRFLQGVITTDVVQLRQAIQAPGMSVLLFGEPTYRLLRSSLAKTRSARHRPVVKRVILSLPLSVRWITATKPSGSMIPISKEACKLASEDVTRKQLPDSQPFIWTHSATRAGHSVTGGCCLNLLS